MPALDGLKRVSLLLDRLVRITLGGDLAVTTSTGGDTPTPPPPPGPPSNAELREDFGYELREDGGYELRDALPPGPPDPYWPQVILLLHGIGAEGGTAIADSSPLATAMVNSSSPVTTTVLDGVFPGGCLNFDGHGYLYTIDNPYDFNGVEFTMETWIKIKSGTITDPEGVAIFGSREGDQVGNFLLFAHNDQSIQFYSSNEFGNNAITFATAAGAMPFDTWVFISLTQHITNHISLTGNLYIHINGVLAHNYAGPLTSTYPRNYTLGSYGISPPGTRLITAKEQEHRVTMAARYTAADYDPPTNRFPEH